MLTNSSKLKYRLSHFHSSMCNNIHLSPLVNNGKSRQKGRQIFKQYFFFPSEVTSSQKNTLSIWQPAHTTPISRSRPYISKQQHHLAEVRKYIKEKELKTPLTKEN